jgi:Na+-transporting methylmalonyl-CoA/oxaloacetate decarboxylase gamma subunit
LFHGLFQVREAALLIILGATVFLALFLLIVTVREYSTLSATARVAGITPSVVLAAVLLGLFWLLAY